MNDDDNECNESIRPSGHNVPDYLLHTTTEKYDNYWEGW